jgi:hypothetical protein
MKWLGDSLKYYNLFTYLYLRYFRGKKKVSLKAVFKLTLNKAYRDREASSTWDILDGFMWILTIIFGLILWGYIF